MPRWHQSHRGRLHVGPLAYALTRMYPALLDACAAGVAPARDAASDILDDLLAEVAR